MSKYSFIETELHNRDAQHQRRTLQPIIPKSAVEVDAGGRTLINFCSNDYLGLSKHPLLKKRAAAFLEKYGAGSTASRLICGNFDCFDLVEKKLASLKGYEAALTMSTGFQANMTILPALSDRNTLIVSDWLNHNSIIQGTLLSRCRVIRFRHNDTGHLKQILQENAGSAYSRTLIVTESVFSMDGDVSDIDELADIAEAFNALLIVDEAHATGVMGQDGMGLTCGKGVDITIGTFGKACGCFGSYIACSQKVREYLINCCPGFIYTTALPPPVIGAIDAALAIIPDMDEERRELHRKADLLRKAIQDLGWSTGDSSTQIIPVLMGNEEEALSLSAWLEKHGILATAIRPPTVAQGQSRIRFTLSASHRDAHLDHLIASLKEYKARYGHQLP
jgi:8-amino-7-oxononanoate synthase